MADARLRVLFNPRMNACPWELTLQAIGWEIIPLFGHARLDMLFDMLFEILFEIP
jgi:hypothetical protein